MENIVKIRSAQGAFDTSGNKNVVDFHIPENMGVIDLSKSYVAMSVRMNADSTDIVIPNKIAALGVADDSGVYDVDIQVTEATAAGGNRNDLVSTATGTLVKHAQMMSNRKGKVESIRNNDVLRVNRAVYLQDRDEQGKSIQGFQKGMNGCGDFVNFSGLNELYKEGSVQSRVKDHEIKIPLSQIVNIADAKDENGEPIGYDTSSSAYGRSQLHLEMKFDKLSVRTNPLANGETTAGFWDKHAEASAVNYESIDNITVPAGGNSNRTLVTTAVYTDLNNSPFYTKQKIQVSATGGTGHDAGKVITNVKAVIHSIEHLATGKIQLNLGNDLIPDNTAGQTYTGVTVRGIIPTAAQTSLTINKMELVATLTPDANPAEEIEFTTFLNENDSFPATQRRVVRNYLIEANCRNVYLMFPDQVHSVVPLSEYRLSLDNKDVTNRRVLTSSPLHRDLIGRTFKNEGKLVKNLRESVPKFSDAATDHGQKCVILAIPVPLLDRPQRLGVEFDFSADSGGQVSLYKEVIKVV
jgi:hypothetical protein